MNNKVAKYYQDLGYDVPMIPKADGKGLKYDTDATMFVSVRHLKPTSQQKVTAICDYCGKEVNGVYYNSYYKIVKNGGKYPCQDCVPVKRKETCLKKYGVECISMLEEVKEKHKQTCLKKYGETNYNKTQECKDKKEKTCLEKYGVKTPSQNKDILKKTIKTNIDRYGVSFPSKTEEVKEKIKDTCIERYGVRHVFLSDAISLKCKTTLLARYGVSNPSLSKEIQEKRRNTFLNRYGVISPMKNREIAAKSLQNRIKNNGICSSKQQLYINNLYNGILNYQIKYYAADIFLPGDNIVFEYDGGGHDLCVKMNNITKEEFDKKELIRFNIIKRAGYKQIHLVSNNDKLPSDEKLLEILSESKLFFKENPERSWIEWNITNQTVRNNKDAEHLAGVFFDFGELRKI